jgi:hypothetical protein
MSPQSKHEKFSTIVKERKRQNRENSVMCGITTILNASVFNLSRHQSYSKLNGCESSTWNLFLMF